MNWPLHRRSVAHQHRLLEQAHSTEQHLHLYSTACCRRMEGHSSCAGLHVLESSLDDFWLLLGSFSNCYDADVERGKVPAHP